MQAVLERAIESLARSGRLVRLREIRLGYMPAWRAALSGALAALLLTYGKYYWYGATALINVGLRWIGNRTLSVGPPPPFEFFVYGVSATLWFLAAGALLGLVRRWSVRKGRFLVVAIGPVAELRAGWHVPLGIACAALLALGLSGALHTLPPAFAYLTLGVGSVAAIVLWEVAHDLILPALLTQHERERAVVEYDLKEALAQDETAVRWRVDRVRFDARTGLAVLFGEFPTPEAKKRVHQLAMRVKGVRDTQLIEVGATPASSR